MRQPVLPQSHNGFFRNSLPGGNHREPLSLELNAPIGGMIAQISLEINFPPDFGQLPSFSRSSVGWSFTNPRPAPPDRGGLKERQRPRAHTASGHERGPTGKTIGVEREMDG